MKETYKVSYKTYFNERLNKVDLHGKLTHPLYVQVTFDRKTITFKSYYFALLSKEKYRLTVGGLTKGPGIAEIIKLENELLDFLVNLDLEDFSLEKFRQDYLFYNKDLCDRIEPEFCNYLITFFYDKGLPALAKLVRGDGILSSHAYDVIRDMKVAFSKKMYDELKENAVYYGPPYLPLYGFVEEIKQWPLKFLTVMEWQDENIRQQLDAYLKRNYNPEHAEIIRGQIADWLKLIKEESL